MENILDMSGLSFLNEVDFDEPGESPQWNNIKCHPLPEHLEHEYYNEIFPVDWEDTRLAVLDELNEYSANNINSGHFSDDWMDEIVELCPDWLEEATTDTHEMTETIQHMAPEESYLVSGLPKNELFELFFSYVNINPQETLTNSSSESVVTDLSPRLDELLLHQPQEVTQFQAAATIKQNFDVTSKAPLIKASARRTSKSKQNLDVRSKAPLKKASARRRSKKSRDVSLNAPVIASSEILKPSIEIINYMKLLASLNVSTKDLAVRPKKPVLARSRTSKKNTRVNLKTPVTAASITSTHPVGFNPSMSSKTPVIAVSQSPRYPTEMNVETPVIIPFNFIGQPIEVASYIQLEAAPPNQEAESIRIQPTTPMMSLNLNLLPNPYPYPCQSPDDVNQLIIGPFGTLIFTVEYLKINWSDPEPIVTKKFMLEIFDERLFVPQADPEKNMEALFHVGKRNRLDWTNVSDIISLVASKMNVTREQVLASAKRECSYGTMV